MTCHFFFLITFLTLLVLLVTLIVKAIRRKPVKPTVKIMAFVIGGLRRPVGDILFHQRIYYCAL